MAKKRKQPKAAAPPPAPPPPPAQPELPAFWSGFEVSWSKLLVGRVVLFGLLAIDALLAIRHAPRYGAGGFNVAQLPLLDSFGPTRGTYLVFELMAAILFTFIALGVASRWLLPLATGTYAWLYFGSQLDSYQHHYLVVLILFLACFVPWERPTDSTPRTKVSTWALRLILIQLGILYFYAAVSKFDPAWLDGRTLGNQIVVGADTLIDVRKLIDATIGIRATSHVVVVVELALAVMVWIPAAWFVAAPLGILFHLGIVFSGLEIGLFAWLMIGIYAFIVPDRIWIWLGESSVGASLRRAIRSLDLPLSTWVSAGVLAALGVGLLFLVRIDLALPIGACCAVMALVCGRVFDHQRRPGMIGLALFVAFGLWLLVDRTSTVTTDYFKFWGGSARRLGDLEGAERAYRKMVAIAPGDSTGHFQLGRLLLARGDELDGMAELHEAQQLEPKRARAFTEEARYLEAHDRHDAALTVARAGLAAEPTNGDIKALIGTLTGAIKPTQIKPSDE